jgi:hypothetical protein
MDIPRHAEVTPNQETMSDLAMSGLMRGVHSDRRPDHSTKELITEVQGMRRDLKASSKPQGNDIVKKVGMILEARGERDDHITYVRSLSMGTFRGNRKRR